jgi:hypothetical protein
MSSSLTELFHTHVPPAAADYCIGLAQRFPLRLVQAGRRSSKVGDFRPGPDTAGTITLNRGLNPYLFLITYVHEVAHHQVHIEQGPRTHPHGAAWKKCFRELMEPVLNENVFPPDLLGVLKFHLRNPKASTFADARLTRALRVFDAEDGTKSLAELSAGALFILNDRLYRKGYPRRTRVLCHQVGTRRRYLISGEARVTEQEGVEGVRR